MNNNLIAWLWFSLSEGRHNKAWVELHTVLNDKTIYTREKKLHTHQTDMYGTNNLHGEPVMGMV